MGTATTWLAVAAGGALGSLARFWLAAAMTALTGPRFPWGTLLINVVGSGIIGLVAAVTLTPARVAHAPRPAGVPDGRHLRRLHHLLGVQPADPGTGAVRRCLARRRLHRWIDRVLPGRGLGRLAARQMVEPGRSGERVTIPARGGVSSTE